MSLYPIKFSFTRANVRLICYEIVKINVIYYQWAINLAAIIYHVWRVTDGITKGGHHNYIKKDHVLPII